MKRFLLGRFGAKRVVPAEHPIHDDHVVQDTDPYLEHLMSKLDDAKSEAARRKARCPTCGSVVPESVTL